MARFGHIESYEYNEPDLFDSVKSDTGSMVVKITENQLRCLESCGSGSYGMVKKELLNGKAVAVKYFHSRICLLDEIQNLISLSHPNIIKFIGIGPEESLVMEYSEIGSLHQILHVQIDVHYSLDHAIGWCLQAASALAYLHSLKPRPMMHRDLKPANLLLFDGGRTVKLCDFGTLRRVGGQVSYGLGTVAYMAPEVFQTTDYTEKCDVYSWTVLLWEVITRQEPYKGMESAQIMFSVCNGKRLPLPDGADPVLLKLMSLAWHDNPTVRPSMRKVESILQDLFKIDYDTEILSYSNSQSL
ncbi:mitogen-activated protein kinase kinase kinase 7-like [Brevipalpus obovatus]|uniref:mitogen-activated protein kinase kinase kinase 7-like n=1 Tax=Brevipalpus obovatus TaxID=246614 RepID=UPI003D9DF9F4